ncbi:hypothetical protein DOY81_010468 [Sarcophaga bullata]|nr:hypothetical protein DOY81_010468 [Sarcophaga bullata]
MKYWPTFWCFESRAQTVFASIIRITSMPKINYRSAVHVFRKFWYYPMAVKWLWIGWKEGCSKDSPCVILLPGLTGESQANIHLTNSLARLCKVCKTIKEFDALFTSKQFGYAHVDDYYSDGYTP